MTTKVINMIGAAKTLILPVTSFVEGEGIVSELRIYELDAKLEVGHKICPESIERLGLKPAVTLRMDSAEKVGVVARQANRMMQEQVRQEVLYAQHMLTKEQQEEMAHIEEMARVLAERKKAFDDKYGPADKGPQHAASVDVHAGNLAQTLAHALGANPQDVQVVSLKV